MIREEIVTKIKTTASSQRKISTFKEKPLTTIFDVINYVNKLDEFATFIWPGHRLDEVPVLNELVDFVLPASVRYDVNDLRTQQLLVRDKLEKDEGIDVSYIDYINALHDFRGNFKRDANSDCSTFATARKFTNLVDCLDKASIKDQVKSNSKPFVPIKLDDSLSCLFCDNRYFNEDAETVLLDYIAEMKFI